MEPAHQGLEGADPAGFELDDRLEEDRQLVALDRGAKLGLDLLLADKLAGHRVVEEADLVLAADLGVVEREIGALHQRVDVGPVVGQQRDTHRGRVLDPLAVDPGRLADHVGERACQPLALAAVGDRSDDDEFVAAEASEARVARRGRAQARSDLGEDLVADRVAERVVDLLEAVEVEPEHRQLAVGAQRRAHLGKVVIETGAVDEPGDRVGARENLHLPGQLGAGFGSDDLLAERAEHVEGDRHHAEDDEHHRAGEHVVDRATDDQADDHDRQRGEQQLADRDERPPGVARRDADAVDQRVGYHQGLDVLVAGVEHRQRCDQPREQGVGEGADLVSRLERARIAADGVAAHDDRHTGAQDRGEDQRGTENRDREVVGDGDRGGRAGDTGDRAGREARRLRIEGLDQLAAHALVAVVAAEIALEDLAQSQAGVLLDPRGGLYPQDVTDSLRTP